MAIYTGICGDTWIGIYKDDILIYEGHTIDWHGLFKLLNQEKIEYFGRYECCLDWLDSKGSFPEHISDVHLQYLGKAVPFFEYFEKSGT